MYIFILIVHVIVCFVLILVVLLQAGRGGGFSDMMGGGQPQSIFGTQTNAFMTRATEVCAVIFIITSLTLGILSTQRGKSLMDKSLLQKMMAPTAAEKQIPSKSASVPAAPETTKAPETKPAAPPTTTPTASTATTATAAETDKKTV